MTTYELNQLLKNQLTIMETLRLLTSPTAEYSERVIGAEELGTRISETRVILDLIRTQRAMGRS